MSSVPASLAELCAPYLDHPWLQSTRLAWPVDFSYSDAEAEKPRDWQAAAPAEISTRGELTTLSIILRDEASGAEVELVAEIYPAHRVLKLGGTLSAGGTSSIHLRDPKILRLAYPHALSPIPTIRRFTGGPWGDVTYPPIGYQVHDVQLPPHLQHWAAVEAKCAADDGRTSNVHQPVMGITNGRHGVLIVLEWAGAYSITCKRDQDFWGHQMEADLSVTAGVEGINLVLEPGVSIPLPSVFLTFYTGTLDEGSQQWRSHFRDTLAPRLNGQPMLPQVSYNHWIAYEIEQFNEALALETARHCADAGIDYLCFDAGWATKGFRLGNGNWEQPDLVKIPSGFAGLGQAISAQDVKFGSWLEPEYANIGSQLYLDHPEWFIRLPGEDSPYAMALMNFGLTEVQDWWFHFFEDWYQRCHVRWVRWDFNQAPGAFWAAHDEPTSQGLTQLRHVTGLYATLSRIVDAFPDLVLEQCASGGTRLEVGVLRRAHSYWINDHSSSPHLVRSYQHGMNHLWPAHYANVNVVSRNGKLSDSEWLMHQAGSFGLSSRLMDWAPEQLAELKRQVSRFKEFRPQLEKEFRSPTGQPALLNGSHELSFGSAAGGVTIRHDLDAGSAELHVLP